MKKLLLAGLTAVSFTAVGFSQMIGGMMGGGGGMMQQSPDGYDGKGWNGNDADDGEYGDDDDAGS